MACAMNAAAMMVGVAPSQAVGAVCASTSSRSTTASKSSLLFNNGGLHVTKLAHSSRARTMQPLRVRAEDEVTVHSYLRTNDDRFLLLLLLLLVL